MQVQPELRHGAPEPPLRLNDIFGFQRRVFADMSGALAALAAYIGDRLGLFRALTQSGPVTAADLARRLGVSSEMTAEWLRAMACAGYLEYDDEAETFRLPPEHAVVLANDASPLCIAGGVQQIAAFADRLPALLDAFKDNGGVPQADYSQDLWDGMERLSATWFDHELVDNWIGALPDVQDTLRKGGLVADVGCGSGRALIRLAKAFPASRFVGYDAFPTAVERATRNAMAAHVADRVRFVAQDAIEGLPAEYDLVTAFDSLHDMPDPVAGLRAMAGGLKKEGLLLVLELGIDSAQEGGPLGVLLHATKLFYNLPVALAAFGNAGGNKAFPEDHMRSLCRKAGLIFVRSLPVRNPLHKLYVLRPASG